MGRNLAGSDGKPPVTGVDWQQFVMDLGTLPPDEVESILTRHGALAVTLTDAADDPVLEPAPGETPLWRSTRMTGLFPAGADLGPLLEALAAELDLGRIPEYRIEALADRPWEREWLKDFAPMRFGRRLWVCPDGLAPPAADAVVVELDPGLAFGSGTHATTALCLEWLDAEPPVNASVLDFGCGSGILAIAAVKLGADRAAAVDIDPQAVTATRANAARNGVAAAIEAGTERPRGQFDVVVANILAGPLMDEAQWLSARLAATGRLALSGILATQAEAVRAAYDRWIDFDPVTRNGDWVRLSGSKRH